MLLSTLSPPESFFDISAALAAFAPLAVDILSASDSLTNLKWITMLQISLSQLK